MQIKIKAGTNEQNFLMIKKKKPIIKKKKCSYNI